MERKAGRTMWLRCEVKPGPFSNERLVRVAFPTGPWVGFVEVENLSEPVERGASHLRALVMVEGERFSAVLPGHSIGSSRYYEGRKDELAALTA